MHDGSQLPTDPFARSSSVCSDLLDPYPRSPSVCSETSGVKSKTKATTKLKQRVKKQQVMLRKKRELIKRRASLFGDFLDLPAISSKEDDLRRASLSLIPEAPVIEPEPEAPEPVFGFYPKVQREKTPFLYEPLKFSEFDHLRRRRSYGDSEGKRGSRKDNSDDGQHLTVIYVLMF